MQKNTIEAANGSREMLGAFQALRINFEDFKKLSPDKQFVLIADRINQLKTDAEKTAAAMAFFGRSGAELIPIMEGGAKSINEMLGKARDLGLTLSKEEAAKIAKFNDVWDSMTLSLQRLAQNGFLAVYNNIQRLKTDIMILAAAFGVATGGVKKTSEAMEENVDVSFDMQGQLEETRKAADEFGETLVKETRKRLDDLNKLGMKPTQAALYDVEVLFRDNAKAAKALGAEGDRLKESLKRVTLELETAKEQQRHWDEIAKSIEHAFERIQDGFADMLVEGKFSFKSLVGIAKKAAAEMTAALVIKPIIGGIGSSILGGLGMPELADKVGGGGMATTLLGAVGNSVVGKAGSSILGSLGVSGAIDSFGASMLPSAFGAGGGLAGLGVGLSAFALPLAGLIAAPLISSLFGKKKHPATSFAANIGAEGGFDNFSVMSKHMDDTISQQLAGVLAPVVKTLSDAGFGIGGTFLNAGFDSGKGFMQVGGNRAGGGKRISFDENSAQDTDRALKELIEELSKVGDISNDKVKVALEGLQVEGKKAADVLLDIADAAGLESVRSQFNKSIEQQILAITDPFQARMNEINDSFKVLLDQAKEVGGNTEQIERLRQLQIQELRNDTSIMSTQQRQIAEAFNEVISNATKLADTFQRIADSLKSTINDLLFGNLSTLSPTEQLAEAKAQFEQLKTGAMNFDPDAMARIGEAGKNLLTISEDVQGKNFAFKQDFDYVRAVLSQVMGIAQSNANSQRQIAAQAAANSGSMAGGADNSGMVSQLAELNKNLYQNNSIMKSIISDPLRRTA